MTKINNRGLNLIKQFEVLEGALSLHKDMKALAEEDSSVKKEIEEFGGTLENFYHYCDKEFGIRQQKLQTRGRPRKVI